MTKLGMHIGLHRFARCVKPVSVPDPEPPVIPDGVLTFEGDTDLLTFEGDTDYITFENN